MSRCLWTGWVILMMDLRCLDGFVMKSLVRVIEDMMVISGTWVGVQDEDGIPQAIPFTMNDLRMKWEEIRYEQVVDSVR